MNGQYKPRPLPKYHRHGTPPKCSGSSSALLRVKAVKTNDGDAEGTPETGGVLNLVEQRVRTFQVSRQYDFGLALSM